MKKFIFISIIAFSAISFSIAQDNPKKIKKGLEFKSSLEGNATSYVLMRYKWKKTKDGKAEVQVKFVNKTKSAVEVDAKIFFYKEGILEESSEINTCLKKGFWDNWFRSIHLVENEKFSIDENGVSNYSIESPELKLKAVENCIKLND